jgi:hypothetical protein
MIHNNRRFGVSEAASVEALVENFIQYTWTLCTAFSLENLLCLNESFSEDGAQEYAVVRDGRQIESITVSWMSRAEGHNTIDWLVYGGENYRPVSPTLDSAEGHHCPLCA